MNAKTARGPIEQMRKIASEEGVAGLWKGVAPAMTRAAALTASQLVTYDESKRVKSSPFTFTFDCLCCSHPIF